MWAAYLGSYTALAAALTAAGQPMALVDVFDLLFGRNAADLSALLPGGAMGAAAPRRPHPAAVLVCTAALACGWSRCAGKSARCCQSGHPGRPAGESYLNLLPQADPQDRAAFLSQYFGLPKQRVGQGLPKNEPGHHHFAGLFRRFQRHHHALHGRRKDVLP